MWHLKCVQELGGLKEGDRFEDTGIGGRIILKWFLKKWSGWYGVCLAEDRNKWRALLKMVVELRVPSDARDFLTKRRALNLSRRRWSLHLVSEDASQRSELPFQ